MTVDPSTRSGLGAKVRVIFVLLVAFALSGPVLSTSRPLACLVAASVSAVAVWVAAAERPIIGPRWTWLAIALCLVWVAAAIFTSIVQLPNGGALQG